MKTMQFISKIFLSLFVMVALAGQAHATLLDPCNSASGLPCVANAGDVLADGVVVPNSGNDFENVVEAAIKIATGSVADISLYGKSDDNPELFNFFNFDQGTSLEESMSGNWSVLDGTLITFITIKAGNSFAVYYVGDLSTGTYTTMGLFTPGGQQPTVSHISFWTGRTEIPEPATALLLGGGLLAAIRRKKKLSS